LPHGDRHRTLQEITAAEMRLGSTVLEVPVLAGATLAEEFTNLAAVRWVPNLTVPPVRPA